VAVMDEQYLFDGHLVLERPRSRIFYSWLCGQKVAILTAIGVPTGC
jgi:hypothetical protein